MGVDGGGREAGGRAHSRQKDSECDKSGKSFFTLRGGQYRTTHERRGRGRWSGDHRKGLGFYSSR